MYFLWGKIWERIGKCQMLMITSDKKINKLGFFQMLKLWISSHHEESEKKTTECEKMFANHLSDRGLVSKYQ